MEKRRDRDPFKRSENVCFVYFLVATEQKPHTSQKLDEKIECVCVCVFLWRIPVYSIGFACDANDSQCLAAIFTLQHHVSSPALPFGGYQFPKRNRKF